MTASRPLVLGLPILLVGGVLALLFGEQVPNCLAPLVSCVLAVGVLSTSPGLVVLGLTLALALPLILPVRREHLVAAFVGAWIAGAATAGWLLIHSPSIYEWIGSGTAAGRNYTLLVPLDQSKFLGWVLIAATLGAVLPPSLMREYERIRASFR